MTQKTVPIVLVIAAMVSFVVAAKAQQESLVNATSTPAAAAPASSAPNTAETKSGTTGSSKTTTTAIRVEPSIRIEGEKRFHANCGRCHMAPTKFAPRAAATVIRHMRVRATITDEDMRYILAYLSQ